VRTVTSGQTSAEPLPRHEREGQKCAYENDCVGSASTPYPYSLLRRADKTLDKAVRKQLQTVCGLSKLSVWWLRLGIQIERIKPGHPELNGRHERMHLT
jgi:hypothetical protein